MINNIQNDLKKGLSIQEVCKKYEIPFLELFSILKNTPRYKPTKSISKYIAKFYNKYFVIKSINSKQVVFGSYYDLSEAISVRDKLIELNWDADPVEYMGDMYIVKTGTGKYVINKKNSKGKTSHYGTYYTRKDARKVRDCLVKLNWDKDYLPLILRRLGVERVGGN